jgi:hypothetical protein
VTFDVFGDAATRGYLRNIAGTNDMGLVKVLEQHAFLDNIDKALFDLSKAKQISYSDVLQTHKTLFESVYPWAGEDRRKHAPDIAITKGGTDCPVPMANWTRRLAASGMCSISLDHFDHGMAFRIDKHNLIVLINEEVVALDSGDLCDDAARQRYKFNLAWYAHAGLDIESGCRVGSPVLSAIAQDLLALLGRQPDLVACISVGNAATLAKDLNHPARLRLNDENFIANDDIVIVSIFWHDFDNVRRQSPRAYVGRERLTDIDIEVDFGALACAQERVMHLAGLILRQIDGADHIDVGAISGLGLSGLCLIGFRAVFRWLLRVFAGHRFFVRLSRFLRLLLAKIGLRFHRVAWLGIARSVGL